MTSKNPSNLYYSHNPSVFRTASVAAPWLNVDIHAAFIQPFCYIPMVFPNEQNKEVQIMGKQL